MRATREVGTIAELYEFLRNVQVVVFMGLGIAAVRQWTIHRSISSAWLAATFGVLGAIVVVARFLPETSHDPTVDFERKVVIAILVLFPYFLYRFAISFVRPIRWFYLVATVLTVIVAVWPFFLDHIPVRGEPRTSEFQVYVVVLLIHWTALSLRAAYLLWRGAAGQPATSRRRMRTLSLGAIGLALALLVSGSAPSTRDIGVAQIATQLMAMASAALFLLGFAPPGFVRAAWRRPEELALRDAERHLMQVRDARGIAEGVLPYAARLVGGKTATLRDDQGAVIGTYEVPAGDGGPTPRAPARGVNELVVQLERGTLTVEPSSFSPFFGQEEADILETLAILSDLALGRARLLEQLQRSNRELEQFAYVASHDLQEPLRTIASYAELIAQRNRDKLDDKANRHIDYIVDGCTRMQTLIDDLLRFSRVGTRGEELVPVHASEPLARALETLQGRIDEAGAVVEAGALPTVMGDHLQLTQLFQNLLSNALKYRRDEPPRVMVAARIEGGDAIFSVADNGLGIEEKYAERIFTIFQRLHTRQEYPGTGIGLAICQKIVERHGGRIWVESDGATGSTFFFALPVASKQ